MKLTAESKFLIGILVATITIVAVAALIFTRPPAPPKPVNKHKLISDKTAVYGDASASAYLVEFSDYQCSACRAFDPIAKKLVDENNGNLVLYYRHFPFDQHPLAFKAAMAVEAAGKQNKYWEYHKLIFENQNSLSEEKLIDFAKQLNLNMDQFTSQSADKTAKDKVEADKTSGFQLGINATPTFFLNGIKLSLDNPQDLIEEVEKVLQ